LKWEKARLSLIKDFRKRFLPKKYKIIRMKVGTQLRAAIASKTTT
jgi:hypothetical protein